MIDSFDDFDPSKVKSFLDWRLPNCDTPVNEEEFANKLKNRGRKADEKFSRIFASDEAITAVGN